MSDAADEVPKRIRVFENGCWNKRPGASMRWPEREYQYLLESHSDDLAQARIEELEAKLAKAVEGLNYYACDCIELCEQLNGACGGHARVTLAELKGTDND